MKISIAAIFLLAMMYPVVSSIQQSASPTAGVGTTPSYLPGLGAFMLQTQIRHLKLWLAGNATNWELADYEIGELKEGLEDAAAHVPSCGGMQIGQMINSVVMAPIGEVEKAIKARERSKFAVSFDKLTEACNSCHHATNRPFIVIQRPSQTPFLNQSFAPKPK